jgi:hypothetical protein
LAAACLSAQSAAAYTCTISPKGDAVTVKTGNPYAQSTTCTATCRFKVPDGIATVTCTHGARRRQGLVRLDPPDQRQALRRA